MMQGPSRPTERPALSAARVATNLHQSTRAQRMGGSSFLVVRIPAAEHIAKGRKDIARSVLLFLLRGGSGGAFCGHRQATGKDFAAEGRGNRFLLAVVLADLVNQTAFQAGGSRVPLCRFHPLHHVLNLLAAARHVDIGDGSVDRFQALLVVLEFLNGAGEFLRVHISPGVHPTSATVHQEEGKFAHHNLLRAHCDDGGSAGHESVEVAGYLPVFAKHLVNLHRVEDGATKRGNIDVARLPLVFVQLLPNVLSGEVPTNRGVNINVVFHIYIVLCCCPRKYFFRQPDKKTLKNRYLGRQSRRA